MNRGPSVRRSRAITVSVDSTSSVFLMTSPMSAAVRLGNTATCMYIVHLGCCPTHICFRGCKQVMKGLGSHCTVWVKSCPCQ